MNYLPFSRLSIFVDLKKAKVKNSSLFSAVRKQKAIFIFNKHYPEEFREFYY